MEATSNRRENLSWPDQDKVNAQLEAICELAKELRTDYPTDTPDEPTNWSNKARNRRNAYIRAQFLKDENGFTLHLLTGSEWLELFDMLGFTVDKETRKRFVSHLNWYSFWYAAFKPRLSRKYAQRIHWYVNNFLFCLRNELQTEKDYREGKYGSKGQAYFMEIEQQPAQPAETPQISTETAEPANVSAEAKQGENEPGMPKYTIYNRDGYTWVVFERGIIRQCAKRSGVSCKCAEWDTIAQAYNGVHSSMGFGNYFFFDSEADAIRFAELVAEGDVCGYWKLYMANLKAEVEAKKQRIAEECAEFDEAQAYFAEIDADRIAQSLTTPPTPPDEPTIHPADKTPTERTETAEAVNVSAEGEKGAEMAENKPYYTHRWRVLHNCDLKTWDKFHKKHKEAILIFHHDTTYAALQKEAVKVSGMCGITYKVNRHGVEVCLFNDATLAQIIGQGKYVAIAELPEVPDYGLTEPPQPPETPQIVECIADTSKPRETARKRPNRAIGSAQHHQHSALGANGYAVLNDASATMAAMSVPRERSTAEAAYW